MTRRDADGAEFLVQLGGNSPPVYPGTAEPVITPRLRANLAPVERAWWSGVDLRSKIGQYVYWVTGGESLDGWDVDDLVGYAMHQAVERGTGHYLTLRKWTGLKIRDLRERVNVQLPLYSDEDGELLYDRPDAGYVPTTLPDGVREWLELHCSPRVARALTLVAEGGYTQAEAARDTGLHHSTIQQALTGLRELMEEQ